MSVLVVQPVLGQAGRIPATRGEPLQSNDQIRDQVGAHLQHRQNKFHYKQCPENLTGRSCTDTADILLQGSLENGRAFTSQGILIGLEMPGNFTQNTGKI